MTTYVPYICPVCRAEIAPESLRATCACGRELPASAAAGDFSPATTSSVHERSVEVRRGMERGHEWLRARGRLVRALIAEQNAVDPLVLDAGCGTGAFAASLAEQGVRVVAVDARLPEALDPGVQYACTDVTALPFADATFDIVLLLDVLEHVRDERAALAQIARVLRPGGSLILTVPARKDLWSTRDELAGHLRRYDLEELRLALTSAGIEVLRIGFWAATTLPLLRVSRSLSRRRPTALRAEERPPAALNAVLRPLLDWDVSRALGAGWNTGSSLFAVGRCPS
jgi:SAM-dependent methyltransferase